MSKLGAAARLVQPPTRENSRASNVTSNITPSFASAKLRLEVMPSIDMRPLTNVPCCMSNAGMATSAIVIVTLLKASLKTPRSARTPSCSIEVEHDIADLHGLGVVPCSK